MNQLPLKQAGLLATLILATGVGGYYFGAGKETSTPDQTGQQQQNYALNPNPLFISQTAMIQGKITKVDTTGMSVVDSKNQTDIFPVSKKFIVFVPVKNTRTATASADLQMVEISREALIILELIDGKYQVVSLSYLP